jgi:hypothetical protein
MFGIAPIFAVTGCVGYVQGPRAAVYEPPQSVYIENGVPALDDYVYYPAYQVYYSSYRRQYVYLHGRSWVSRPVPPRVSVDLLFASRSVKVDFHDSPANHHAAIVRTYPKNWTPQGESHDNKENRRESRAEDNTQGDNSRN